MAKTFDERIGERIRWRRHDAKKTQAELAALVRSNAPQISRYEKGIAPVSTEMLARIADALGFKVSDLLDGIKVKR